MTVLDKSFENYSVPSKPLKDREANIIIMIF